MSDQTAPALTAHKVRPLYWSIRRELWENPSVWFAPLVVAGLALFGFLISSFHLASALHEAQATIAAAAAAPANPLLAKAAGRAHGLIEQSYSFATGSVLIVSMVVTVFYALSSLYAERRDRSILFWKSLPVSDLTTVLSKVAVAFLGTPLVVLGLSVATSVFILVWTIGVLLAAGGDVGAYLAQIPVPFMWVAEARGLVIMMLWYAPIVAWLMLVSGWARRVAILWALGPWAALCVVELLAFHTTYVWAFIRHRLAGGFELAFTVPGGRPLQHLADLNPLPALTSIELWAGVVIAVGLLVATVRLRRYRDPI